MRWTDPMVQSNRHPWRYQKGRTQVCVPFFVLVGGDCRSNFLKLGIYLRAKCSNCSQADHHDQREHDRILNCGRPIFLFQEIHDAANEILHLNLLASETPTCLVCDANLVCDPYKRITRIGSLVSDFRLTNLGAETIWRFCRFPWQPGDPVPVRLKFSPMKGPVALRPTLTSGLLLSGEQG